MLAGRLIGDAAPLEHSAAEAKIGSRWYGLLEEGEGMSLSGRTETEGMLRRGVWWRRLTTNDRNDGDPVGFKEWISEGAE